MDVDDVNPGYDMDLVDVEAPPPEQVVYASLEPNGGLYARPHAVGSYAKPARVLRELVVDPDSDEDCDYRPYRAGEVSTLE